MPMKKFQMRELKEILSKLIKVRILNQKFFYINLKFLNNNDFNQSSYL